MEKDSQIKAIAEACRWELHDFKAIKDCSPLEEFLGWDADVKVWRNPAGKFVRGLPPNYPSDLNACHDAEWTLTSEQHAKFRETLREIQSLTAGVYEDYERAYLSAPPEDRAEAFLRTIGKWEDQATTHVDEGGVE